MSQPFSRPTASPPTSRPKAPSLDPELVNLLRFATENSRNPQVVPWIGAGFSRPSGYPDMKSLLTLLLKELRRQKVGDLDPIPESAIEIAERIDYYLHQLNEGQRDYAEVAFDIRKTLIDEHRNHEFYSALRKILVEIDETTGKPSLGHYFLQMLGFRRVVTTNYDQLIERHVVPAAAVVTCADQEAISYYSNIAQVDKVVFKLHGDIGRPDTIPFSEEDFANLYAMQWTESLIRKLVEESTILFLGTSLSRSEKYYDHLVRIFSSSTSTIYRNRSAGAPKLHFALLPEPGNKFEKSQKESALNNLGIRVIWYQTTDDQHSQIWEFLSDLAATCRKPSSRENLRGAEYRAAYRPSERRQYPEYQLYHEKSAALVSFITPDLTNAIATDEYLKVNCLKALQSSSTFGMLGETFHSQVIDAMLERRDNLVARIEKGDIEVRALCSLQGFEKTLGNLAARIRSEDASPGEIRLATQALANNIERYKFVIDLASRTDLNIRMSEGFDEEETGGYMPTTYALIVTPYSSSKSNLVLAFATQASYGNFGTQLVEANSALVQDRMARAEQLWWSASTEKLSLSLIAGRVTHYESSLNRELK